MNKKLLTILSLVIAISSCKKNDDNSGGTVNGSPQITAAAFVSSHSAGSKLGGYRLDSGSIKFPSPIANTFFNYDTVTIKGNWADTFKTPLNTTDFAGATYMRGINQQILNQNVSLNQYFQVTSSNWTVLGNYLDLPVNITIPSTGSLTLPPQANKQSPNLLLANFPINYNDSANQTSNSSINGTATAFGTTGPIAIAQETKVNSKNIAWGNLKLKGYSNTLQCVVQKYTTISTTTITSTNITLAGFIPFIISTYKLDKPVVTILYRFWAKDKGLVMTLNGDGSATVTTGL